MLKQTSKPATLCQATMASGSTTDTFFLPIHKSGLTSLGAAWVECYMTLALSSDWVERATKMEELITMCFATSRQPTAPETAGSSTLEDIIQTLSRYEELRVKHGNTLGRTGMYSWMIQPQSQLILGEVLKESGTMCGLRSQMHQHVTSFLRLARRWLREISFAPSVLFRNTPTRNTERNRPLTPILMASPVVPETPEPSQVSRNGYFRISRTPDNLEEWDNEDMDQSLEEILKELED